MSTDHNEAVRLAVLMDAMDYEDTRKAAALLRQQSERIAELEGELRQMTNNAADLAVHSREVEDERDQQQAAAASLLSLLADIRKACGDDGKRMQPELVEFIGAMKADGDQLRAELALRPWRPISPARIAALWSEACKPDRPTSDMVEAFVRLIEADHGMDAARTTHKETE